MGTYTANYQLYMPSIGEQGWGDLMNGNLTTIDTTMKGLNTRMGTAETNITSLTTRMGTAETTITSNKSRIGTLETETDALDSRIKPFEDNISFDSNGNIIGNLNGKINLNVLLNENAENAEFIYGTYSAASINLYKVSGTQTMNSTFTENTNYLTDKFLKNLYNLKKTINFTFKLSLMSYETITNLSVSQNGIQIYNVANPPKTNGNTITYDIPLDNLSPITVSCVCTNTNGSSRSNLSISEQNVYVHMA